MTEPLESVSLTDRYGAKAAPHVPPSVYALFGGRFLYGQERANIEVLKALKAEGSSITILMRNDKTPEVRDLKDMFSELGFKTIQVPLADARLAARNPIFMVDCILGLFVPSFVLARMRAGRNGSVLYLFNTYYVPSVMLYLFLFKPALLFRAGDVPPSHNVFWRVAWGCIRARIVRGVAVSRYIKKQLVRMGVDEERLSVIYSRPRLPKSGNSATLVADEGIADIVYVGQLTAEKGLRELADAFVSLAKDHDCRLVVIGRIHPDWPEDAFARALRDSLGERGYADRVTFPGFVDDVYAYLSRARVHVQPSVWEEPLANSVMEAKWAGVPSVIFASGGLPEVIQDGFDGTICYEQSAEALAEAIRPYLLDSEMAARRGEAARASLKDLGTDRFAENWRGVVDKVAARS